MTDALWTDVRSEPSLRAPRRKRAGLAIVRARAMRSRRRERHDMCLDYPKRDAEFNPCGGAAK